MLPLLARAMALQLSDTECNVPGVRRVFLQQ